MFGTKTMYTTLHEDLDLNGKTHLPDLIDQEENG